MDPLIIFEYKFRVNILVENVRILWITGQGYLKQGVASDVTPFPPLKSSKSRFSTGFRS